MDIELAGNYRAEWGEGPIWWEDSLYFVDIEGHKVLRHDPRESTEKIWEIGERVGTVVPRQSGGLVVAGDSGFAFLDSASGEVTPLGDPESDKPNNRFNDGKCSPDGRFFAGTISLEKKTGAASLYRLDADRSVTRVIRNVTNSNGLVWTADGETMFYIDTPRLAVLAFDYESAGGSLHNERIAFSTDGVAPGVPDGMAIDTEGNLWIAFCHGGCVVCFDQQGSELRRLEFPCREVTAPAFGGELLEDLYVTTGIPKTEVEAQAGRLFVVRGLGVSGLPAHGFAG
jgi:sugar lactone lactonase YvrE